VIPGQDAAARDDTSRCWTLHTAGRELDVEVVAPDDARLAQVLPALAQLLGTPDVQLWTGSSLLDPDVSLAVAELAHGAVLGVGRPGPRTDEADRSSALELHVVGGPDAGRTAALGHGERVIGRGTEAHLVLTDPDVSRRHLLIHVGTGEITVADPGSTNGTFLDGDRVTAEPQPWSTGPVLRLGNTALAITGPSGYPLPTRPGPGGRRIVHPTSRVTSPPSPVEIRSPRPPAPPAHRRLAWFAVGLPIVGGVLLAVLLHTPHFLFFALLGPAAALGTWVSERWSGRRSSRSETARYREELLETARQRTAAVRADVERCAAAHPSLATLTSAARRRTHVLWSRRGSDPDALTVRLGTGSGQTSVVEIGPDGSRVPVPGADLPVVLDLRVVAGLGVVAPRPVGLGIMAGLLAQLSVLHAPGQVDLLLLVAEDRLRDWAWVRWLPHLPAGAVRLHDARQSAEEDELQEVLEKAIRRRRPSSRDGATAGPPERSRWLVVVIDRPLDARSAGLLRDAGSSSVIPLTLADTLAGLPLSLDALLTVTGETGDRATLTRRDLSGGTEMVVDRLPPGAAARLARDLAPLQPARTGTDLPRRVRLLELPVEGRRPYPDASTGSWSRDRGRLVAPLGQGPAGSVEVDLCRLGPHMLVAGTTGSGKSEFLQTLIAGLALNHPPDRCAFLLVDYKGGAAFAEAAALPHTVGMLTDLDGRTTERALRSLTAELVRREKVLAAHHATDLAALPEDVALARLVIVVDEFATLTEEHPSFVPGLVGIAQRGRSLGVHLVLATQRPSGVVSPEIRANAALRVCLRTTDEADSRDILGVPSAAHLPADRPGRAYLRSNAGTPFLFQVARVAGGARSDSEPGPQVRPWLWPLGPVAATRRTDRAESDLARIATALRRHSADLGMAEPHRPWMPPLPNRLGGHELQQAEAFHRSGTGPPSRQPGRLAIGLVDKPAEQAWDVLELDLASGGGWLAVGAGRSGRTTFLRTVLGEAVRQLPPAELHVHVLDQGGGALASEAAGLPHAGTTVPGDDPLRTIRLVSRLSDEVAARRSTGRTTPRLLLLVDGVEPVMEQLDEFDPGGGSAAFLRLVRDGAAAGLTCLLTADRAVPGGRLAAAVGRRLVLPLADMADYVVAGVPASAVPATRPPGRALLGDGAWECQLALPRPFDAGAAAPPGADAALRIPPLPGRPAIVLPGRTALAGDAAALRLPLGPGGDEGGVLEVDLVRTGGLLVAGPPGSGRASTLAALADHLTWAGVRVARLTAAHGWDDVDAGATTLDPADQEGIARWLEALGGRPGAVVADDVGLLADAPVLARMPPPGHAGRVVLLAAATAGELARCYQGPVAALRRRRAGLVLCPAPGDGEPFGIRLPRLPLPRRPGSGWLVTGDTAQRVQVARRERSANGSAVRGGPA
jgi:S-DNA-T family DNA segregation ATPase FtsK/SpoIIIE